MPDLSLDVRDWIWSAYTTSPDPASGMQSLYQTCSAFTKHVLQPSHIALVGGGFTLHADLAGPLTDIIPAMDHLLRLAERHYGLHSTSTFCQRELRVLTETEGLIIPATRNQIVWNWVHLLNELYLAMARLKSFWMQAPLQNVDSSSRMSQILESLPPSLRIMLPKDFLEGHGIMSLPPAANVSEAASQKAASRKHAESLPRSPTHRSPMSPAGVEVGGLASPEEIKGSPRRRPETSGNVASYDYKLSPADGTGHALGLPDPLKCVAMATVDLAHTGRDTSMSELVYKFTSYPTPAISLLARITCIVKLKSLGNLDVTDRGIDCALGQFGLETSFYRIVINTVQEMQSILTGASSLVPNKDTCFLVDPHGLLMRALSGANAIGELQATWTALRERMCLAQRRFEEYQSEHQIPSERSSLTSLSGDSPLVRGSTAPTSGLHVDIEKQRCSRALPAEPDATYGAPLALPPEERPMQAGARDDKEPAPPVHAQADASATPTGVTLRATAPAVRVATELIRKRSSSAQTAARKLDDVLLTVDTDDPSSIEACAPCHIDTVASDHLRSESVSPVNNGSTARSRPGSGPECGPKSFTLARVANQTAVEAGGHGLRSPVTALVMNIKRASVSSRPSKQRGIGTAHAKAAESELGVRTKSCVAGIPLRTSNEYTRASKLATVNFSVLESSASPVLRTGRRHCDTADGITLREPDVVPTLPQTLQALSDDAATPVPYPLSFKSPAPASAIASAVELGGLHKNDTEWRARDGKTSERAPAYECTSPASLAIVGQRVVEWVGLENTTNQSLVHVADSEVRTFWNSASADDIVTLNPGASAMKVQGLAPGFSTGEDEPAGQGVLFSNNAKLYSELKSRTCNEDGHPRTPHGRSTLALATKPEATRVAACTESASCEAPAPGIVFDGAAVELGGLEEVGEQQSFCAAIAEIRTLDTCAHANATSVVPMPPPPIIVMDKAAAESFAFVSAIVRTRAAIIPCAYPA